MRRRARPTVGAMPEVLLAEMARLLREHKGTTLMAALLTGLVAGMSERKSGG